MEPPALEFEKVTRRFPAPSGEPRTVLADLDLTVAAGESVAVVGRSGTGKSTFLHLAAGIDRPSAGAIRVAGREISDLAEPARAALRRDHIGLVFQFFHLLPHLDVAENVALPAMIAGEAPPAGRVDELLARVDLTDRRHDAVTTLSGGEQQRVALCRALLRRPKLLLADEPTGNLDDETGRRVFDLLLSLVAADGATLVLVTHSPELAARADRALRMRGGALAPA